MTVRVGVFGINVGNERLVEAMIPLAVRAEQVGLESVWSAEHVMIPAHYGSTYPFDPSGKVPLKPESTLVDPLVAFSHIAAATKTLRMGTGINLLAQSNPLLFAKQTASVDYLSGGRLMLGVGVGWLKEEFDALGVPFEHRGSRMDDYMTAIRKVWSGEVVEHQSGFLNWSGFKSYPLPAQSSGIPFIIGGHSPPALRRAARSGQGWFGFTPDVEALAGLMAQLKTHAQAEGRDPATIEITTLWDYGMKETPTPLERYQELGITRVLVFRAALGKDPLAGVEKLAASIG